MTQEQGAFLHPSARARILSSPSSHSLPALIRPIPLRPLLRPVPLRPAAPPDHSPCRPRTPRSSPFLSPCRPHIPSSSPVPSLCQHRTSQSTHATHPPSAVPAALPTAPAHYSGSLLGSLGLQSLRIPLGLPPAADLVSRVRGLLTLLGGIFSSGLPPSDPNED